MDLVIICFIENPPSSIFKSAQWPLHMTLLPPFSYFGNISDLQDKLKKFADDNLIFSVFTNERELFGPNKDIPVAIIQPNEILQDLYKELLNLVEELGVTYEHPSISGLNYRFHITDQRGKKVTDSTVIPITSFSLIDRRANGQSGLKQVLQTFHFAGK